MVQLDYNRLFRRFVSTDARTCPTAFSALLACRNQRVEPLNNTLSKMN